MNKKNIMSFVKKLTAGVLAVGMVVAGVVIAPKQADAAVAEDKVIYVQDNENYNINNFWNADDTERKTPVREGYVFGGWFKAADANTSGAEKAEGTDNYYAPLTEDELKQAVPETAYAKFVPAQVLSVKAQNGVGEGKDAVNATTVQNISPTNPMWVRVMTSLDSKNYAKVGFDIYLANVRKVTKADGTACETTKAYSQLYVGGTLTDASTIFGGVSKYACVWKLDAIDTPSNADKIIYVRPYWYTMDGTKVLGLAKYVHIEDEYNNYISVPVNVSRTEDIAAGAMTMTYVNNGWTPLTDDSGEVLLEAGRIFPNMEFEHNSSVRTIKMVGYEPEVNINDSSDETIFANIRFKAPDTIVDADLEFDMTLGRFCNWAEKLVENMKVWDIAYEVKATTNE